MYLEQQYAQYLPSTQITVDGVERKYHLFVPADPPQKNLSLLVILAGGDAASHLFPQQDAFEKLAESEGIVLAFPVGKRLPHNEGAWQLNSDETSMQDINFVTAMINDIAAQNAIDRDRVYAIGYSLGSMFSYELACQMSDRFAAIASYAGTMPVIAKSCAPPRNVPLMHIHALGDGIIAYDKTWNWKAWDSVGRMHDVPGLLNYWTERYQCQNSQQSETETSIHIVYGQCDQRARVEHYGIKSEKGFAAHEWPQTINGIATHQVVWSFLRRAAG
jgi:polyhydroxybutyrate depolymerase